MLFTVVWCSRDEVANLIAYFFSDCSWTSLWNKLERAEIKRPLPLFPVFCSRFLPFAIPRFPQIRDRSTIHLDIIRVIELIFAHSASSSYKCTRHDKVKSFRSNSIHNNCAHYPIITSMLYTLKEFPWKLTRSVFLPSLPSSSSHRKRQTIFQSCQSLSFGFTNRFFSSLFQLFQRVSWLICRIWTEILCEGFKAILSRSF